MGVPAHDERDFLFAQKYGLPIRQVIAPMMLEEGIHTTDESYGGSGILVNSGEFNGITNE
ncbi:MAG: Leucine-tRNA ligase, partial [Candidatus Uhrbacteria bacterium GW2011_GWF2_41_16]